MRITTRRAPAVTDGSVDLSGRTAVVTGAAGAIGAAVTRRFTAAGARVIGLDARAGSGIIGCDVTDESAVGRVLARIGAGMTDLVHCAGVLSVGEVLAVPASEIRQVLDVNLMSCFIVAQAAGRRFGPGATMTFLGSQAGVHGAPGWAAYCAAKAGVTRRWTSPRLSSGSRYRSWPVTRSGTTSGITWLAWHTSSAPARPPCRYRLGA
jgi:NAD(P)-dependent dehydrogenase (short-subunit alcohol dehydrogenase family)